jgi:hypothetical protein
VIAVIVCNRLKNKSSSHTDFEMIEKLGKGVQNIKANINRVISTENVDQILMNKPIREGLIKIFNAKDFYN